MRDPSNAPLSLMTNMQPARPTLHAIADVMQTMPVVLNSGLSVNPKYMPSQYNKIKKNMLQKGPETEKKKFGLGWN